MFPRFWRSGDCKVHSLQVRPLQMVSVCVRHVVDVMDGMEREEALFHKVKQQCLLCGHGV